MLKKRLKLIIIIGVAAVALIIAYFAVVGPLIAKLTATEEEINTFCLGLPRYKRPRKVIFEHVPRNPTGKIEKPVLRQKYCHGRLVEAQNNG